MGEPDKVHWICPDTDLDCLVHRGPVGALCGYVGVGPDHVMHGMDYQQIEEYVRVHGGLTFSNVSDPDGTEDLGIWITPQPDRPSPLWWFGFDCAHWNDRTPGIEHRLRDLGVGGPRPGTVYRGVEYVGAEVAKLARQLAVLTDCSEWASLELDT